jgi:hypothetical protein
MRVQNQSCKSFVGLENFIIAMAREDDKVVDVVGTETLEN